MEHGFFLGVRWGTEESELFDPNWYHGHEDKVFVVDSVNCRVQVGACLRQSYCSRGAVLCD